MMRKNDNFLRGYYCNNSFETAGELEGSGRSGRIDAEIAMSEDASAPTRKSINLNSDKWDAFGVPMQILSLSNLSRSERKELLHKLTSELEQVGLLQKKVGFQRTNGVALSSSSDILACKNGLNGPQLENFRKSSLMTCGPGKKVSCMSNKSRGWNRGTSGRFQSAEKPASITSTANIFLMKHCETLLKRLMSHQYGWVFNTPVDAVKLNIPDYYTVIKQPMDLGAVKRKIASNAYSSPLEFLADVRLTFSNAMTYNPPGNDVHIMADTLHKFFEARWKAIEKKLKLPVSKPRLPQEKSIPHSNLETAKAMPPAKRKKVEMMRPEIVPSPIKPVMTEHEKHNLGRELESLLGEIPVHIIDFLRERSSNGKETGEDEIEIDIDDLSDDTLLTLRKLLDDYLAEKLKGQANREPCEIELLNESGLSNSSMQQGKDADLAEEDIDIGGNEPPVSSYPPVEIEKDAGTKNSKCVSPDNSSESDSSSSSESEFDDDKSSSPIKVPEVSGAGAQPGERTSSGDSLDMNQSVSGLDQLEQTSQKKLSSVESDCGQDGDSAPNERQVSPDKLYRAALLKNRFADTILKAREKTLSQGEKGDPEKLRREREKLEVQKQREKARLQAEAKAAEEAQRRAEAAAAAEARRQREVEREAARQALLKIERTVEINENSHFLEDLEMLRTAPAEQLPSSVDETSPEHSQDGLGSFKFGGSNPLEQLGLYMKEDDDEEDAEPPSVPDPLNDVEEGEID